MKIKIGKINTKEKININDIYNKTNKLIGKNELLDIFKKESIIPSEKNINKKNFIINEQACIYFIEKNNKFLFLDEKEYNFLINTNNIKDINTIFNQLQELYASGTSDQDFVNSLKYIYDNNIEPISINLLKYKLEQYYNNDNELLNLKRNFQLSIFLLENNLEYNKQNKEKFKEYLGIKEKFDFDDYILNFYQGDFFNQIETNEESIYEDLLSLINEKDFKFLSFMDETKNKIEIKKIGHNSFLIYDSENRYNHNGIINKQELITILKENIIFETLQEMCNIEMINDFDLDYPNLTLYLDDDSIKNIDFDEIDIENISKIDFFETFKNIINEEK